tara:strand:- start:9417 stop:9587 length:171 start_codon:yes stop_codon:yes gene_type:complete
MITMTMKQAEMVKGLLTKANKGTQWLDKKIEAAGKAPVKKVAKKVTKKVAKKVSKK